MADLESVHSCCCWRDSMQWKDVHIKLFSTMYRCKLANLCITKIVLLINVNKVGTQLFSFDLITLLKFVTTCFVISYDCALIALRINFMGPLSETKD